ncbi:hypothetical protein BH18THE1_BH18THE1_18610 [soil metagenome]
MERHVGIRHAGQAETVKKDLWGNRNRNYENLPQSNLHKGNYYQKSNQESDDGFFPGFSEIEKRTKRLNEFINNHQTFGNIINLQSQLNSLSNQLSYIHSNYWLVPKDQRRGLSGHYCKRCLFFTQDFIRFPGYDMTAEYRHRCDEVKVKSIWAVSIRPSDVASLDNFLARDQLKSINLFIPGIKYVTGGDLTGSFNEIAKSHGYDAAKRLLGIPDRYCLYTCYESKQPNWLTRVLENLDEKNMREESEFIDFLKRAKSSYGIFEILTSTSPKLIWLRLVA